MCLYYETDIVWQRNPFMDQQTRLLEHLYPVFRALPACRVVDSRRASADHQPTQRKRWR